MRSSTIGDDNDMEGSEGFDDSSDDDNNQAIQVATRPVTSDPIRAQLNALAVVQTSVVAQARAQSESQAKSQEMFVDMVRQTMQQSYAKIEFELRSSAEMQALNVQSANTNMETRFGQALEQLRVIAATQVECHIDIQHDLGSRIQFLEDESVRAESSIANQLQLLRQTADASLQSVIDISSSQYRQFATEIADSAASRQCASIAATQEAVTRRLQTLETNQLQSDTQQDTITAIEFRLRGIEEMQARTAPNRSKQQQRALCDLASRVLSIEEHHGRTESSISEAQLEALSVAVEIKIQAAMDKCMERAETKAVAAATEQFRDHANAHRDLEARVNGVELQSASADSSLSEAQLESLSLAIEAKIQAAMMASERRAGAKAASTAVVQHRDSAQMQSDLDARVRESEKVQCDLDTRVRCIERKHGRVVLDDEQLERLSLSVEAKIQAKMAKSPSQDEGISVVVLLKLLREPIETHRASDTSARDFESHHEVAASGLDEYSRNFDSTRLLDVEAAIRQTAAKLDVALALQEHIINNRENAGAPKILPSTIVQRAAARARPKASPTPANQMQLGAKRNHLKSHKKTAARLSTPTNRLQQARDDAIAMVRGRANGRARKLKSAAAQTQGI